MGREMKDSGVPWIGKIPVEWSIVKIKAGVTKVGSGKTPSGGATTYTDEGVLFLRSQNVYDTGLELSNPTYITPEVDEEMKGTRVFPNDVLLNITGGSIGRCCIFPETLKTANVNQHVSIIRVNQEVFLPEYMHYYWVSPLGSLVIDLYQTGGNREGMSAEAIKNTPIILIPLDEQRRICKVLDGECSKIDAVLEKTRTSIKEYKKLKQAIITQAVTKGIRGDRPMKESGVEWVDAIPEEIKVSRLGLHYDIILGKMLCSTQVDDTYTLEPYYCAADVHFEGISNNKRKMMWFSPSEKELYLVKKHDLLVVEGGAGAGGCAIIVDAEAPSYIQNSIMIVRSKNSGDCRYLRYWLECLVRQGYIDVACNKATIPHFTKDKLAVVPYFVFSAKERTEIANYLDTQCKGIDAIIQKKEQLQLELESYKKSLIYEYVTGKKEA